MDSAPKFSDEEKADFLEYSGHGLTTTTALQRLHDEINNELNNFEWNKKANGLHFRRMLHESFHHKSYFSLFRWTSILFLFLCCGAALVTYLSQENVRFEFLPAQIVFVVCVVSVNMLLMLYETKLRHSELPDLTRKVLAELKALSTSVSWEERNYPHLHSPLSPCITLQWTKRDHLVVNLPWSLLVRGDVILLRPGQRVPGKCQQLDDKARVHEDAPCVLQFGEVFSPFLEGVGEGFTSPKARTPLQDAPFLLLETPYLINLRVLLARSLDRPVTIFRKQAHLLFARGLEMACLPLVLLVSLVLNALRVHYAAWPGHWSETLLLVPVCASLPLLPLAFPLAWVLLNWIGSASVLATYQHALKHQRNPCENPFEGSQLLQTSEALCSGAVAGAGWREAREQAALVARGRQGGPIRTADLLHVLASVTNLCCVDKKGVLSWPNPTAEKLFFLRSREHGEGLHASRANLMGSATSLCAKGPDAADGAERKGAADDGNNAHASKESECVLLSLTHDHLTAFGLQFDDRLWRRHMLSLKPLGLNILLNTCNPATQNHYTRFCSHITCEAMYNEHLVPVSQRRCLCELPKQIGFRSKAQEPFHLEHQLSTFRHVPLNMACKDRLARSLSITKLKFPFPHMVSVMLRDKCSGKLELMSQGTADIVLDSCTDYWDGSDIRSFTDKDRKKVLDFYHRTSLSAYCTAFSYRPTSCAVKQNLTNFYMELPMDPTHLYRAARTPTPHISTEALFGDTAHTEYEEVSGVEDTFRMQCKQIFIGMVTMQYQARTDMVRLIEELDESCIRFVHFSKENELRSRVFSEKMGIEAGWNCHISLLSDRARTESGTSSRAGGGTTSAKTSGLTLFRQSNEDVNSPDLSRTRGRNFLRSKSLLRRVMGRRSALEVSRALSHSAPSAINLEVAQVKFDEDVSVCSSSGPAASEEDRFREDEEEEEEEERRLVECAWEDEARGRGARLAEGEEPDWDEEAELCRAAGRALRSSSLSTSTSDTSSSSSSEPTSAAINFDMSNRARLPKGIENIRPHLATVDNVPLLVSLFTDCGTASTQAMVAIMQESTEVAVVLGSTANNSNMVLFMQADLCIGVDPSHPQVCMREPVFVRPPPAKGPPPTEVASRLNALPCSLTFRREDRISLVQLILKSRHLMQHSSSCFQFWASCNLSVAVVQLAAVAAFLPPILHSGDVLWLVCVPIPLLSVSLSFAPLNPAVMNQATGKNAVLFDRETAKYLLLYYAPKFAPSFLAVLLSSVWLFSSFCALEARGSCDYVYPPAAAAAAAAASNSSALPSGPWGGWGEGSLGSSLVVVQKGVAFQIVVFLGVISVCFVHRMYHLWHRNPFTNRVWAATLLLVFLLQVAYTAVSLIGPPSTGGLDETPRAYVLLGPALVIFLWPLVILPLNELIKRREIRVNVRYQKRARLEFGTKLGMNSPF